MKTYKEKCTLKASENDEAWCWYMTFGHELWSTQGLKRQKDGEIDAFDQPSNQLCEACLIGKHARRSFLKEANSRAKESLQLIHAYVCWAINPSSLGKNKYFFLYWWL